MGIGRGIYAVVESASFIESELEVNMSEIFRPITKEVARMEGGYVAKLKFYLADVEAIVDPCVVIPNIGGARNDYFLLKNREEWHQDFCDWLEAPQFKEDISEDEADSSDSEEENFEENEESGASDEDVVDDDEENVVSDED